MKVIRLILIGLVVLASHWVLAQDAPESNRVLRIAIENYPPYEYVEDGEPKGINVEIIRRILTRLNVPCEFSVYPFPRGWLMLKNGAADASPSLSYTKEREPYLFYTDEQRMFGNTGVLPGDYLWITRYVFLINHKFEESLHFENYEQIRRGGYRIGIVKEYTYNSGFLDQKFSFRQYVSIEDGIHGLLSGEIDLFPVDETVARHVIDQMGLTDKITVLPKVIFSKPYLMVFSKKSDFPGLEMIMLRFNAELKAMRKSGEIAVIRQLYMPEPIASLPVQRPLLFVCEEWNPFAYMDGNTLKGIDVEVTRRIMNKLGIAYEIRIYPWSRAWLMVCNGKADAVLSVSYKSSREGILLYTADQQKYGMTGEMPQNYLWLSEYVFFVKKKYADLYTFESYEQLQNAGYRIGKNRDYTYDEAFMNAKLSVVEFPDTHSGMEALIGEQIDLYPMDKTVGIATLKSMGLMESVTFLPLPLFTKPYLAPFVKLSDYPDTGTVMEMFNRELREMRARGELDAIRNAYLGGTESTKVDE